MPINTSLTIPVVRIETLLDSLRFNSPDQIYSLFSRLEPYIAELYVHEIMGVSREETKLDKAVLKILNDSSYLMVYRDVYQVFSSLSSIEPVLATTVQNFRAIMEEDNARDIHFYTLISEFALQCFLFSNGDAEGVGISLDMFLGRSFPYETIDPGNPQFSSYISQHFTPENIPVKIVDVLLEDRMPLPHKNDFLHLMIWGGKKLYAKDKILDFLPDSTIIEYTAEQLAWCRDNEREMWNHFFEKGLFYETELRKFNKLISPSPSSPGMPSEAPGQTGNYMGWQIVSAFMQRNPQISIKELFNIHDAQYILDNSKYKPRR